jgi:hypothetical protein
MPENQSMDSKHLEWMINSRAANLRTSLFLLNLFRENEGAILGRTDDATMLVAISFSLWRAAFLADKTGVAKEVVKNAQSFLEKMIVDNSIQYRDDVNSREWTFNYYMYNAESRLSKLARTWHDILGEDKPNRPRDRWNKGQRALDKAVKHFAAEIGAAKP